MKLKRIPTYLVMLAVLTACGSDEPKPEDNPRTEEINPAEVTRTVVVYAVNRSSLSPDFTDDFAEMTAALQNMDLGRYQLLVYHSERDGSCGLYRSVREERSRKVVFELLRSYDSSRLSTDPRRIGEVIDYALSVYPDSDYDLVFWGHGMSWYPYFSSHEVYDAPTSYSYGGEYSGPGSQQTDWTEIDELADAVPDRKFDTIWFDCCYMSGIEVIYQFRDKCSTFVGYPTEVWQYGLPYDRVLPYIMSDRHDVVGAARTFYDYYTSTGDPVTVAVTDMSAVGKVADVSRAIFASGDVRPSRGNLLNYSRSTYAPFYDLRQYLAETAVVNGRDNLVGELDAAMGAMVTYHAESSKNFNQRPWDVRNISGVSTHACTGSDSPQEKYYRTLDWYRTVMGGE